jgi:hypothetical protein
MNTSTRLVRAYHPLTGQSPATRISTPTQTRSIPSGGSTATAEFWMTSHAHVATYGNCPGQHVANRSIFINAAPLVAVQYHTGPNEPDRRVGLRGWHDCAPQPVRCVLQATVWN